MVESAPLFIEYYCTSYVHCNAFWTVVGILVAGMIASWFSGFFCYQLWKRKFN